MRRDGLGWRRMDWPGWLAGWGKQAGEMSLGTFMQIVCRVGEWTLSGTRLVEVD